MRFASEPDTGAGAGVGAGRDTGDGWLEIVGGGVARAGALGWYETDDGAERGDGAGLNVGA